VVAIVAYSCGNPLCVVSLGPGSVATLASVYLWHKLEFNPLKLSVEALVCTGRCFVFPARPDK
jgi:hypothetical protein